MSDYDEAASASNEAPPSLAPSKDAGEATIAPIESPMLFSHSLLDDIADNTVVSRHRDYALMLDTAQSPQSGANNESPHLQLGNLQPSAELGPSENENPAAGSAAAAPAATAPAAIAPPAAEAGASSHQG